MKIDRLIEETTEKDGVKKWAVVLVIILGVVLAYFGLGLYLDFVGVNTYISETKQVVAVYDFYDLKVGETETAVYFIGSSLIGCGIDSDSINRILKEEGYDITAYNLGIDGDVNPLQTSLQIQNIIDSKPALVIFGVSPYMLNYNAGLNEEKVFLVRDKLDIRSDAWYLYSNDDKIQLLKPHTFLDNKRFVDNAKAYSPRGIKQIDSVVSTDLYALAKQDNWRYLEENNVNYNYNSFVENAKKNNIGTVVTKEMTEAKSAMLYNAKTLSDAGIPVIFINMPIHPETSNDISDESRQIFFDFLDTIGVKWYDYEYACQDDDYWYKDGYHMAPVTGAGLFAPVMADLIIQELS